MEKLDLESFTCIWDSAAQLAAQGFLDAGSSILAALAADFPKLFTSDNLGCGVWGFEFLWEVAGNRPKIMPWEPPTTETLDEMEKLHGEECPQTLEEKQHALDVIDTRIRLGEILPWPYSLRVAAMISVELGDKERALKYLNILYRVVAGEDDWERIIRCRSLAPIIIEGNLGRFMGQTAHGAQKDAEAIITAFRSWETTREPRQKAREAEARKFATLGTRELLEILEAHKTNDEETLQKPPAVAKEISEAGTRLGLTLPQDYQDFLLVSNGLNFMPSLELPALRPVEELVWEEAADLGLDDLEVTLGLKVDERESKLLPKMGRLLMISSADDEEKVWLLDPSQVENALQILKTERQLSRFSQPVGWRTVLWRHWCPDTVWYRSFRAYLEAAAKKA
ncbi:hypothetical protein B0H19DRAFT_1027418 [Mycena capillaripes]|nr:hypothetical protein B0H19DRAFT_1027418 [Mycena capillaripes]